MVAPTIGADAQVGCLVPTPGEASAYAPGPYLKEPPSWSAHGAPTNTTTTLRQRYVG